METLVSSGEALVTDVEVLQEILPIGPDVFVRAKDIVMDASRLSARDALHVAVMQTHGIRTILNFDTWFEAQPGIERLG